uniref:Uncharacterized protein n=1 Tax=Aegilops tauschii subsp. strangulata TaxID=200361 RepID=A0A452ZNZ5_AEGTS
MKLVASCLLLEGGDAELGGGDAAVLRRRGEAVAQGGAAQVAERRRRLRRLRLQRRRGRGRGRGRRRGARPPRSAHLYLFFSDPFPHFLRASRSASIRWERDRGISCVGIGVQTTTLRIRNADSLTMDDWLAFPVQLFIACF